MFEPRLVDHCLVSCLVACIDHHVICRVHGSVPFIPLIVVRLHSLNPLVVSCFSGLSLSLSLSLSLCILKDADRKHVRHHFAIQICQSLPSSFSMFLFYFFLLVSNKAHLHSSFNECDGVFFTCSNV